MLLSPLGTREMCDCVEVMKRQFVVISDYVSGSVIKGRIEIFPCVCITNHLDRTRQTSVIHHFKECHFSYDSNDTVMVLLQSNS